MISGPFCGHLFADHGAEVIKVEPEGGDVMRTWGLNYHGLGLYWPIISRGKKSVTLDLRSRRRASRTSADSPPQLTWSSRTSAQAPSKPGSWGPEDLHRVQPDLTIVRISGFGQDGPYRDRAGFGSIAEAMSGFRHLAAEPGRPPGASRASRSATRSPGRRGSSARFSRSSHGHAEGGCARPGHRRRALRGDVDVHGRRAPGVRQARLRSTADRGDPAEHRAVQRVPHRRTASWW